jgi:F0F1-type ATP synthase membrane subunit b/b'
MTAPDKSTPEADSGTPEAVDSTPEAVDRTPKAADRTPEQVRQEIEAERERLLGAIADLRSDVDQAAKKAAELKSKVSAGLVVAVGIGATMRYLARRHHRR